MKIHQNNTLGEFGSVIGKGLLAGLAATAAITLSQMIEMKITGRKPSEAPVKIAKEITGIKPQNEAQKEKVSHEIHWAYGTSWGIARGIIGLTGLKGVPAAIVHFGAIWGTSMIILPKFNASPPITEKDSQAIAIDGLHHAVYAATAGLVYNMLDAGSQNERKLNKLVSKLRHIGLSKKP